MKRITYVGTAVLVDDDFGTTMLEYAAALARSGTSETLEFHGVSEHDSRMEEVGFIVGPASEIVIETLPEGIPTTAPDNSQAIAFMRRRINELRDRRGGGAKTIAPEPQTDVTSLVDGIDI